MTVDPTLVYGPYGAVVLLLAGIVWVSRQWTSERSGRAEDREACERRRESDAEKYEGKIDAARNINEQLARSALDALKQAGIGKETSRP